MFSDFNAFFISIIFIGKMSRTAKIRSLNKINERELVLGNSTNETKSWHRDYKDSAWIYIGGLDYALNEGDLLSVFSQ